jgi:hypothetical protein
MDQPTPLHSRFQKPTYRQKRGYIIAAARVLFQKFASECHGCSLFAFGGLLIPEMPKHFRGRIRALCF